MKLSEQRYWSLLLHMVDNESEIDDKDFFLARDGKTNPKEELDATLDALLNETRFDDNSTACRFPARKAWLEEKLDIKDLPRVECTEYNKILKRLSPKSATLVFPSAHINSPASMFGHTFLRINSAYKSKLLSYAVNYAADANTETENGFIFAIKGLIGGYYGRYSLLPYYEKLKEYRDTEKRDIWEYDLDLNEEEVLKMVRHIWELNGTQSYYYFFTENCSYNMLWLIEIARPSIHLREYFSYEVIPLETVHAVIAEGIVVNQEYRPSKRAKLLKYEKIITPENLHLVKEIVNAQLNSQVLLENKDISQQQKQYILEASIEFLEYSFSKNKMKKNEYLRLFHELSKQRASLGQGKKLQIKMPSSPAQSHKAKRLTLTTGVREGEFINFLNFRPAYHDLEDSNYGFLRGTQIEFLNIELSYSKKEIELEKATLISIVSLAQRSEFFDSFSWRTKYGWDREYLDNESHFIATLGFGFSWGNEYAYTYTLIDPLFYMSDGFHAGIGGTLGLVIDKYDYMSTSIELTSRYYDSKDSQNIAKFSQSFRISQNFQFKLKYDYIERKIFNQEDDEQTYKAELNYYF